jgi:hypothetical protein
MMIWFPFLDIGGKVKQHFKALERELYNAAFFIVKKQQ